MEIKIPGYDDIKNHQKIQKARIFDQFNHDEIRKGISVEEFGERYSPGFNFHTEGAVNKFKEDFMKGEDPDESILAQTLDKLKRVDVEVSKGEIISFFVEKIDAEDQ